MFSLLVAIIFLAYVSLGLPDGLLGSAWPVMQTQIGVDGSFAGIISATIICGTILSSIFSNFLTNKLSSGLLTALSVTLTAVALFGFALSTEFWQLILWSIPYGLGAGAVDATLNNYAAVHFSSKHMNWLHAFWGVGALIGPFIMGGCLQGESGWQGGYQTISIIQIALTVVLFLSLPLWKKSSTQEKKPYVKTVDALKIKGIFPLLVMFFCYCAMEQTAMLWTSSYLASFRQMDEVLAAEFGSLFFIGMTVGRFVCGFFSNKLGDNKLIVVGVTVVAVGIAMVMLPLQTHVVCCVGLVIVGIGCAPIYPAIIHSTPANFGEQNSQAIVGLQMACAYAGSMLMPPVFGVISQKFMGFYPYYLAIFLVLTVVMFVILRSTLGKQKEVNNG